MPKKDVEPSISVIVPVYNETENILPLIEEIEAAVGGLPLAEIIYVDDCSNDNTPDILREAKSKHGKLRILHHNTRSGQSAAIWTGATHAKGDVLVTLDGDGQNDPADIPKLYEAYRNNLEQGTSCMVAGQRAKRQDSWIKRWSSKTANAIRSTLLRDGVRDTGCGLKLAAREDFVRLPYFNHMHRFLPALMHRNHVKVELVDVNHRPRERGQSKYGTLDRLAVGISDLFGVMWLIRRGKPDLNITEE